MLHLLARCLVSAALALEPAAPSAYIEAVPRPMPDAPADATIDRLIELGTRDNHVMDHLTHLTERIGPRLTGSSGALAAGVWSVQRLTEWGLSDPHLELWGTIPRRFDRGPSTGAFFLRQRPAPAPGASAEGAPTGAEDHADAGELVVARTSEFTTLCWSPGTDGPRRGRVVRLPQSEEELTAAGPALPGAWVLLPASSRRGMREVRTLMQDWYARIDESLRVPPQDRTVEQRALAAPVAGFVCTGFDERVWTGATKSWRDPDPLSVPAHPLVQVRLSDYDFLNSRLADRTEVWAEFALDHRFTEGPIGCFNTLAQIPGSDRRAETIIVSAHLDSWDGPGSQGATDNGAGASVVLEAARLLMAANAQPRRTILFALWTGEEQGLLGSRGWVRLHADRLEGISAMFNDDSGTDGHANLYVWNEHVDALARATALGNDRFRDPASGEPLRVTIHPRVKMPGFGGSDHAAFSERGIPAFYWSSGQRADYARGWHTQYDRLDLAWPEHLKHNSLMTALTAYALACDEHPLARPAPDQIGPSPNSRQPGTAPAPGDAGPSAPRPAP